MIAAPNRIRSLARAYASIAERNTPIGTFMISRIALLR